MNLRCMVWLVHVNQQLNNSYFIVEAVYTESIPAECVGVPSHSNIDIICIQFLPELVEICMIARSRLCENTK